VPHFPTPERNQGTGLEARSIRCTRQSAPCSAFPLSRYGNSALSICSPGFAWPYDCFLMAEYPDVALLPVRCIIKDGVRPKGLLRGSSNTFTLCSFQSFFLSLLQFLRYPNGESCGNLCAERGSRYD
jgi:hypothetical protein